MGPRIQQALVILAATAIFVTLFSSRLWWLPPAPPGETLDGSSTAEAEPAETAEGTAVPGRHGKNPSIKSPPSSWQGVSMKVQRQRLTEILRRRMESVGCSEHSCLLLVSRPRGDDRNISDSAPDDGRRCRGGYKGDKNVIVQDDARYFPQKASKSSVKKRMPYHHFSIRPLDGTLLAHVAPAAGSQDVKTGGDGAITSSRKDSKGDMNGKELLKLSFPASGIDRYHMVLTPVAVVSSDVPPTSNGDDGDADDEDGVYRIAVYTPPVKGAGYDNLWHTFSDFYTMLYHTLTPLLELRGTGWTHAWDRDCREGSSGGDDDDNDSSNKKALRIKGILRVEMVWITTTPRHAFRQGFAFPDSCRKAVLFDPFRRLFGGDSFIAFTEEVKKVAEGEKVPLPSVVPGNPVAIDEGGVTDGGKGHKKRDPLEEVHAIASGKRKYDAVLLGIHTRCSPIPTEGVEVPECQENLRRIREDILKRAYPWPGDGPRVAGAGQHLDSDQSNDANNGEDGGSKNNGRHVVPNKGDGASKALTVPIKQRNPHCPTILIFSRQKDKFRRMAPFDDVVRAIRQHVRTRVNAYGEEHCDAESTVQVLEFHGGITFEEQLRIIRQGDVLIAGRGGGTGFYMFLNSSAGTPRAPTATASPKKGKQVVPQSVFGGYLSVSGHDRWNPFRLLVPSWIALEHHQVKLVHHEDPSRPCAYIFHGVEDANRCGYKVTDIKALVGALEGLLKRLGY